MNWDDWNVNDKPDAKCLVSKGLGPDNKKIRKKMEPTLAKQIELENHQTLVISDLSRKIGEDAFLVVMQAKIEIKIEKKLFISELPSDYKFQDILDTLGDKVTYDYKIERNFIMAKDKDEVFESLMSTFLENLGQYVAKPNFPEKLILKAYKDRLK